MKVVVASAINIYNAGPLSVARDFFAALGRSDALRRRDVSVVAFVHDAALYDNLRADGLEYVSVPRSRRSWLVRLFYEYVWFGRWSSARNVDTWVSLHDVTPNVHAARQFVYCHNPAIFYTGKSSLWTWRNDPKFELFRLFYARLYRANLNRNERVVVQQDWLRKAFASRFGFPAERIIVAQPRVALVNRAQTAAPAPTTRPKTRLIYPAYPRFFKNHEVLVEAMRQLRDLDVGLTLTFDGNENGYAGKIHALCEGLESVEFTGFLSQTELFRRYDDADAMVFASTLETWGLPLSEFRQWHKPIFVADLPYAREPLQNYAAAQFFDPFDPAALARVLRAFCESRAFTPTPVVLDIAPPLARSWDELIGMMALA